MTLQDYYDTADQELKYLTRYTSASIYGEGECPGKTLARMLKLMGASQEGIKLERGNGTPASKNVLSPFVDYYTVLYSSKNSITPDEIEIQWHWLG